MLMLKYIAVLLIAGATTILSAVIVYPATPITYRFRLEAAFTFDGKAYIAIGYLRCTYEKAPIEGSDPYRSEGPIFQGYYTKMWRDAPSVVLADGKSAIVIPHAGGCLPLPILKKDILSKPREDFSDGTQPAYYFPDRNDPKAVWILADRERNAAPDSKRYFFKGYRFINDDREPTASLAQNVPIAWRWYERMSAENRTGHFEQKMEDVWFGLTACLMYEDEWRNRPEFVEAARPHASTALVTINEPGKNQTHNCTGRRTPNISLIPSDDYSKATLDPDRADLRWATISTPPQYQDKQLKRWVPEICAAGEECAAGRKTAPFWVYLPRKRIFALIEQPRLETFRFPYFAVRPGDGL